ncbi:MAG TPA: D-2-hydroxyacid dehydrogenase [Chloroflexia bacterium]|nr:D-2-hydroxyacid dehydrogenase [Chloroflexia bacterium]
MEQRPENVFVSTYFEPHEIARLQRELDKRGLKLTYYPQFLTPARFPAEHVHEPNLTPEQEKVWLEGLRQADIMLDFDSYTLPRWRSERLVPRLRWMQATSAGVGQTIARAGLANSDLIVTTASGIHAGPLAEFALMALLMWVKDYPLIARQQREHHWEKYATDELPGKTLAIIGPGKIGREIARLAHAFGMRVLAAPSSLEGRTPADYNADALFSTENPALYEALKQSDALLLAMPHTPQTERMIGATEFAALKKGAYFINIARGKVVDEEALIAALQSGQLGGAALDVFDTEPLPADSPFWDMPNVIVAPHSASTVYRENERIIELFLHNLDLFLAGRYAEMRNVLDVERMY